ncbi:hypothetical protein GCM10029976_088570 [Kribbella albertanoniae]|uniref:hypothetical protein n=1 Tax=Kribbella albertanoniae TaxID=1266829 RepID=UPI001EDD5887|nr:hypothetical protein [Kribbella albertanoniae]
MAEHAKPRPEPTIADPVGATVEPALQTTDDVTTTAAPAPFAGARRRLSPRPVPVSRRRKAAAPVPGAGEEPNPAEEMGDVGNDDKAGKAPEDTPVAGATKTAKPRTAAEIVAEQRAREEAAASAASSSGSEPKPDDTAVTKPVSRVSTAAPSSAVKPSTTTSKGGKQALSSVGSGVRQLRNLLASLIWLVAVLAAALLALGALFTALDQTNQSNEIVRWVLERGHDLVGPFKDLFRLETAKNTLLVNWGIAALVYLIAGKILERFIRP